LLKYYISKFKKLVDYDVIRNILVMIIGGTIKMCEKLQPHLCLRLVIRSFKGTASQLTFCWEFSFFVTVTFKCLTIQGSTFFLCLHNIGIISTWNFNIFFKIFSVQIIFGSRRAPEDKKHICHVLHFFLLLSCPLAFVKGLKE